MSSSKGRTEKGKIKKPKRVSESYLYNSGLYYLQRFPASEKHFKKVLITKVKRSCYYHKDQDLQNCIAMVDETAKKFKTLGLLNDEEYTKAMVHSLRKKGKSTKAIAYKLREKSVSSALIKKHLYEQENYSGEHAELYSALILLKKRHIGPFNTKEIKEDNHQKNLAVLARSGFSYDIATKALHTNYDEALNIINNIFY